MSSAEHRVELVAALRSGKYKQGRSWLHPGKNFCCLGVACDISGIGNWNEGEYFIEPNIGTNIYQPNIVGDYYGFDRAGSMDLSAYGVEELHSSLAFYNDAYFTFPQIADLIEWYDWDAVE